MTIKADYSAFDGIIFDVDGTLWDSTPVVADAYNITFEKEGVNKRVTADDLKHLFGKPMDVIFEQLFPETDKETRQSLADKALALENELLAKNYAEYYPQTRETLLRLSKRLPLFIVSNCQSGYIESFFEGHGTSYLFKDIECYGNTGLSKGENIKLIIERNGLKNAVYTGDTQGDADAASFAGIPFIYAAYGFGNVQEYDYKLEKFADMEEIFL